MADHGPFHATKGSRNPLGQFPENPKIRKMNHSDKNFPNLLEYTSKTFWKFKPEFWFEKTEAPVLKQMSTDQVLTEFDN